MRVDVLYHEETPAAKAKKDVIVRGFAALEGQSRTSIRKKLDEIQIRGEWASDLKIFPINAVNRGPRTVLAIDTEVQLAVELTFGEDIPESYAAEVIADNSGKWVANQLRFATKSEAEMYGLNLFSRWLAVRERRAVGSADPINARWKDGHLERLQT